MGTYRTHNATLRVRIPPLHPSDNVLSRIVKIHKSMDAFSKTESNAKITHETNFNFSWKIEIGGRENVERECEARGNNLPQNESA